MSGSVTRRVGDAAGDATNRSHVAEVKSSSGGARLAEASATKWGNIVDITSGNHRIIQKARRPACSGELIEAELAAEPLGASTPPAWKLVGKLTRATSRPMSTCNHLPSA